MKNQMLGLEINIHILQASPLAMNKRYRVLVACYTLGKVDRGFEQSFKQLADAFVDDDEFEVVLVGGRYFSNPDCIRNAKIPYIHANSLISRAWQKLPYCKRYHLESLSFGLGIFLKLSTLRPSIVMFSQPHIAPPLAVFKRFLPKSKQFKLLFSNGGPSGLSYYRRWTDFTHFKAPWVMQDALHEGYSGKISFLVPNGFYFTPEPESINQQVRDLPELILPGRRVILSVAALCANHKRLDFLIRSLRPLLKSRQYQLICLGAETSSTSMLRKQFGDLLEQRSIVFKTVPPDDIVHYLDVADVFVNSSLSEGFGRAIVEAVAQAVPVVLHDSADFRWLTGGVGRFIDMTSPDAICSAVSDVIDRPPPRQVLFEGAMAIRERLSWTRIKSDYKVMFRKVLCSQEFLVN